MKKYIPLLLCLLATLLSVSCAPSQGSGEADHATQAEKPATVEDVYEAVIVGELSVLDKQQGEIRLQDLRITDDGLRLGESVVDGKAVLDLDGDGIEECVIRLKSSDQVLLRYREGVVYSYFLPFRQCYDLKTDGTFLWNDASDADPFCYGGGQFYFDGTTLKVKEIYKIVNGFEPNAEYYIDGRQVTYEELLDFNGSRRPALVEFTALESPWLKTLSLEEALEIAETYWYERYGIRSGDVDSDTGYPYAILSKSGAGIASILFAVATNNTFERSTGTSI